MKVKTIILLVLLGTFSIAKKLGKQVTKNNSLLKGKTL
jgi:hypothetical protein